MGTRLDPLQHVARRASVLGPKQHRIRQIEFESQQGLFVPSSRHGLTPRTLSGRWYVKFKRGQCLPPIDPHDPLHERLDIAVV